jgi:glucose/arabinose dehydrogenase
MDISDRVSRSGSEEGLLGFALAPDFATSRAFYVYYAARPGERRTVVSRFTANAAGTTADVSSEAVILQVPQPFSNHKGGQIAFGPEGMLYVGLGDGGSGNDPNGNGQNLNTLLAKILRIDVGGTSGNLAYRVPADNPFVGRQDARAEVWAYGLRNPWRFSFDTQTGELWVGDVGQSTREEIDVVTKGGNYGWNVMEGEDCRGGGANCNRDGKILPVIDYPTGADCSVSGGFVYRGTAVPSLAGAYVYGDYCSGKVWALRYDGTRMTEQRQIADSSMRISSFARDNTGELYVLAYDDSGGGIFRIAS